MKNADLPNNVRLFAREGLEPYDLTPLLRELLKISENLDKEFPKVLQRLEEIEKQQEKIGKRLTQVIQDLNTIDSKAVSREEMEVAEERLLEVLNKHGGNAVIGTHELEGGLEGR